MDETLGDRIKHARLAVGMTQRDLARRIGVSETTLRNWEGDHTEARADLLARLQGELEVDLGLAPPTLRCVDPAPAPTRGKRQTVPRLDDATTPQMLAELHARDARLTDQLRAARQRNAELETELAQVRGLTAVDPARTRDRYAARHDDTPPDPGRDPR